MMRFGGDLNMNIYNGWIILDKPKGMSSNDAVQKVRRFLGKSNKVGHAGTLDPLAEGVLPIAVGEATKTVQYLMNAQKEYEFSITWGEERSTGDAEGEVTVKGGAIPKSTEIQQILSKFMGAIIQVPPIYSALKINGQPAYKLARKGLEVELKQREIFINNLELLETNENSGVSTFRVICGKGTYVRSLAVDIARALGTYGYVSMLKRTRVGNFLIKDAIMLANLINLVHNDETKLQIFPVNFGLGDILAIEINADQAKALRNGLSIFLSDYSEISKNIVQILNNGILQALVCLENGLCKPIRVFNL
jgi:tRNA pseudouridine55 synthase